MYRVDLLYEELIISYILLAEVRMHSAIYRN